MGLFLSEHKKIKIEKMIPLVLLIATTLVSAAPEPYSYQAQRIGRHYYETYIPTGGYGSRSRFRPSFTSFNSRLSRQISLDNLGVSEAGRAELRQSAAAISAVTTFITQLRDDFTRFEEVCTGDKQYNLDAITAVGSMLNHLADMAGSLGAVKTGESIRKGKVYAERIVAELSKIDPQDLGTLDCSSPGDFSTATATLRDLATIIDDVGIDNLQQQLGINLSFVFA